MRDITRELELAGFKEVESLCNTYTALIPEKKLRVLITVNKEKVTYNGSFTEVYKNVKDYLALFKKIYETELADAENTDVPYEEVFISKHGKVYSFFNSRVLIAEGKNGVTIIIDGEKHHVDSSPDPFINFIATSKEGEEKTIENLKTFIEIL